MLFSAIAILLAWPASRSGHCAALLGDSVYLMGGLATHSKSHEFVTTIERYDLPTQKLQKAAKMPEPRAMGAVATFNNSIYFAGGINQENKDVQTLFKYEPSSNKWTSCAPMRRSRSRFTLTRHGSFLYAVGGINDRTVEIYDPTRDRWKDGPQMQHPLHAHATVSFRGKLVVLGGNRLDETSSVLVLDEKLHKWVAGPAMPNARTFFFALVFEDKLFVIGRHRGSTHPAVLEDINSRWKNLPDQDCNAERFAAILHKETVYAFGSEDPNHQSIWSLSLAQK